MTVMVINPMTTLDTHPTPASVLIAIIEPATTEVPTDDGGDKIRRRSLRV